MDFDTSLEPSHRRLVRRWREQLRAGEWNPNWIFNMATWTVNELVPIWILHELDSRSVKRTQKQRQILMFQSNTCAHFGCTDTKLFNNLSAVHLPWNISFHTVPPVILHVQNHQSHSESNSNAVHPFRQNTGSWEQQLKVTSMGAFGWNSEIDFEVPSRKLTYPTLGKGKSSSNVIFDGIC